MVETDADFWILFPRTDAFIRDESSKGRYDPAITAVCFEMMMELFERVLKIDLGERVKDGEGFVGDKGC